jgi:hypothetical protein
MIMQGMDQAVSGNRRSAQEVELENLQVRCAVIYIKQ